jgi:hypothetical protein
VTRGDDRPLGRQNDVGDAIVERREIGGHPARLAEVGIEGSLGAEARDGEVTAALLVHERGPAGDDLAGRVDGDGSGDVLEPTEVGARDARDAETSIRPAVGPQAQDGEVSPVGAGHHDPGEGRDLSRSHPSST